jgi:hypothetical protein
MSEQMTSLPANARVASDGRGIATLDATGVGAALAAELGATLGAVDGATLTGACDGAVVAPEVHAERVMARAAIAAAAVRNERMQELLHETLEWFHTLGWAQVAPPPRRDPAAYHRAGFMGTIQRPRP